MIAQTLDAGCTQRGFRLLTYSGPNPEPPGPPPAGGIARIIRVDGDFSRTGTWTGVSEIIEQAYLSLRARGESTLIERHDYALNRALPAYRTELLPKYYTLTDSTQDAERTRNFPLDRAYRLINSLVEVTLAWKRHEDPQRRWRIVVERFDLAQHLASRYFAELARRGTGHDGFEVVVETAMHADAMARRMPWMATSDVLPEDTELGSPVPPPPALEEDDVDRIGRTLLSDDFESWERLYPALLRYFRGTGDVVRAADVSIHALCLCNHYGYYHEAASFADGVLAQLDALVGDNQALRWNYLGNLFTGLVTTGREQDTLQILLDHAEPRISLDEYRARMHYLLSMIFLRFLKTPDMAASEHHLMEALASIEACRHTSREADYLFLRVFINNGLAFLRVRQGRHVEAMELCRTGYGLLTDALGEEKHRLHRSVLQYNIAQVYAMLGENDNALAYYQHAMEMDPHYSEYYNEAGNLLQRSERFAEAEALYDRAIEFSAPYPEVHFNKGICALNLGRTEEATANFARSLELNPLQPDVYALRAELLADAGDVEAALRDYDTALALAPNLVAARVNRAVLHYEAGRFEAALADMDRAIALEPQQPDHYLNRAEIHKAMAQRDLYQRDLAAAEACREAA